MPTRQTHAHSSQATRAPAPSLAEIEREVARNTKALRELEAPERNALLASRLDLPASLVAVLRTKPLKDVKAIVNAMPNAAVQQAEATRAEQLREMDRRMGTVEYRPVAVREGNTVTFGTFVSTVKAPSTARRAHER